MNASSYWYARGYYDGRAVGVYACPEGIADRYRRQYRLGYDTGVIEHAELDTEREDAA